MLFKIAIFLILCTVVNICLLTANNLLLVVASCNSVCFSSGGCLCYTFVDSSPIVFQFLLW